MADDLAEKIKSIMSDPEAMNMISSLMSANQSNEESGEIIPADNSSDSDFSKNLQLAMSSLNRENDKRVNLLKALQPYMRKNRASGIDKAIKMLKITQITSVLKDL